MSSEVKKQMGMTLIELMLACVIGSMLLMVLSAVFASGLNTSARISQQLTFDTQFHDLEQFIRADLRRAGFSINGNNAGEVKWQGATQVVYVNAGKDCLAYAYEFTDDGTGKVRYSYLRLNDRNELVLFTNVDDPQNIASACTGGEAISEKSELLLTRFEVDISMLPVVVIDMSAQSPATSTIDSTQLYVTIEN